MRQERGKTRNLVSSRLRDQELKNTAKKRSGIILFRGSNRGDLQKDCVQVQMYGFYLCCCKSLYKGTIWRSVDIVTAQLFLIRVIVLHCTSPSEATLSLIRLTITCGSTENKKIVQLITIVI